MNLKLFDLSAYITEHPFLGVQNKPEGFLYSPRIKKYIAYNHNPKNSGLGALVAHPSSPLKLKKSRRDFEYSIMVNDKKALDSPRNSDDLINWSYHGGANQVFKFEPIDDKYGIATYQIKMTAGSKEVRCIIAAEKTFDLGKCPVESKEDDEYTDYGDKWMWIPVEFSDFVYFNTDSIRPPNENRQRA